MAEALVPGPSHRVALCDDRDERHRDQELPDPPPCTGRTLRHAFSDDAIALIHQVGRGMPRAVHNLAVQALVAAFATSTAIINRPAHLHE